MEIKSQIGLWNQEVGGLEIQINEINKFLTRFASVYKAVSCKSVHLQLWHIQFKQFS